MTSTDRNQFEELLLALHKAGVDFIVCGGLAAVLHGVERPTLDLDIATPLTPENLGRLIQVIEALGLKPRVAVNPAILADPDEVRHIVEEKQALVFTFIHPDDPLLSLDIFLSDGLSYDSLRPHAVERPLSGATLLVLSLDKLLALKRAIQPPRNKDLMDIAELERLRGENGQP